MAKDPGIDYGMGQSNIDHETGIRYGVIPIHNVMEAWADSAELEYPEHEPEDGEPEEEICFDDSEPIGENYYAEGYKAIKDPEDPDIMILKSPYFTYAQFCSPCAPGAGYLRSYFDPVGWEKLTGEEYKELAEASSFPKVYCFGHDWFREDKAPYRIFRVDTGKEVTP